MTHRIGNRAADHLVGDGAVLPVAGLAHLAALGLPEALPGQRPLAVVPPLQPATLLLIIDAAAAAVYDADGEVRVGGAREGVEGEVRDGVQVRGAEGLGRNSIHLRNIIE